MVDLQVPAVIAPAAIEAKILALVRDRGVSKTICPSEVARALQPDDWRSLMPEVRAVGAILAQKGLICCTQKGNVVDLSTVKGPIRFKLVE
ncbi:MAG: DUF3253 domain-containing protein [Cyanobacteria bacterium P01_H01_bin.121]